MFGWGAVIVDRDRRRPPFTLSGVWRTRPRSMPAAEACALLLAIRAMRDYLPLPLGIVPWLTDCAPTLRAVVRMSSRSVSLGAIVADALSTVVSAGAALDARWVPTHLQWADAPSRGLPLPAFVTEAVLLQLPPPVAAPVPLNRRLLPPEPF
jgi:hypothetical protein